MCYDIWPRYSLVSYVVVPNQRKQWQLLKHLLDENFFLCIICTCIMSAERLFGLLHAVFNTEPLFFCLRQVDGGPDAIGVRK